MLNLFIVRAFEVSENFDPVKDRQVFIAILVSVIMQGSAGALRELWPRL